MDTPIKYPHSVTIRFTADQHQRATALSKHRNREHLATFLREEIEDKILSPSAATIDDVFIEVITMQEFHWRTAQLEAKTSEKPTAQALEREMIASRERAKSLLLSLQAKLLRKAKA